MGKTIFITGSSSGIGRETALYFADKGWNVLSTMRNPEKRGLGAHKNITYLHLDVTDNQSIQIAVNAAFDQYGTIDVLLNNAGYGLHGVFESITEEQIAKQFNTNVFGLMQVTRALLPFFRKQKAGVIINVSSIGGTTGFPLYSIYQATKFAVEGFTEALYFELQPLNIKVRLIEPGVITSDFYTRSADFGAKSGIPDYKSFEDKVKHKQTHLKSAPSIIAAKKIYKAAVSKSWKLRYPVGPDAYQLVAIRKILPFSLFRKILRNMLT